MNRGFLLRQLCKRQLFRQNSTVDCKYLVYLQDFFLDQNQKSTKNANVDDCLKNIWKLIKNKVNVYNQQLNF